MSNERTSPSSLAPLVFADSRGMGQQANKRADQLTFVPVQELLLEAYEKLTDDSLDFFGFKQRAINTVTTLLRAHLQTDREVAHRMVDADMLKSTFELIDFLDRTYHQLHEIDHYRSEAQEAIEYVEKQTSGSHTL